VARKDGIPTSSTEARCGSRTAASRTFAIVWARLDGAIRGFIVEKGTPGYSTKDIHGKFSLRASVTSELTFQDCHIPCRSCCQTSKG